MRVRAFFVSLDPAGLDASHVHQGAGEREREMDKANLRVVKINTINHTSKLFMPIFYSKFYFEATKVAERLHKMNQVVGFNFF